jgi:preprotein translocase subunit SecD
MGVDANVISSERINEEIRSGKSVCFSHIEAGFSNSFFINI